MNLVLHDSKSGIKRKFSPITESRVKMYVCGPTVYAPPHIGNIRSAVVYDLLYRVLKSLYSEVDYVRNITDIDDKIIETAKVRDISTNELALSMADRYHKDLKCLGCLPPTDEPKATEHLEEMFNMISKLIARGHAYISEGHVLFDVTSYPEYGELSSRKLEDMFAGARIKVEEYKRSPMDFVLWKPSEDDEVGYESPWGRGRPGWHIECSAMSMKYLGSNFDIHGGGIDLLFPHHENESAQTKCAEEGAEFANFWVHNGFLTVHGEKMSKSLGNFYLLEDVLSEEVSGPVMRHFYLSSHYRKPIDYNRESIRTSRAWVERISVTLLGILKYFSLAGEGKFFAGDEADFFENVIAQLNDKLLNAERLAARHSPKLKKELTEYGYKVGESVLSHLKQDLNSVAALRELAGIAHNINKAIDKLGHYPVDDKDIDPSAIQKLINDADVFTLNKDISTFVYLLELMGFSSAWLLREFSKSPLTADKVTLNEEQLPHDVRELLNSRKSARESKNWSESDRIRNEIEKLGYAVEDAQGGQVKIRRKG